jgi:hypothetical protein
VRESAATHHSPASIAPLFICFRCTVPTQGSSAIRLCCSEGPAPSSSCERTRSARALNSVAQPERRGSFAVQNWDPFTTGVRGAFPPAHAREMQRSLLSYSSGAPLRATPGPATLSTRCTQRLRSRRLLFLRQHRSIAPPSLVTMSRGTLEREVR